MLLGLLFGVRLLVTIALFDCWVVWLDCLNWIVLGCIIVGIVVLCSVDLVMLFGIIELTFGLFSIALLSWYCFCVFIICLFFCLGVSVVFCD